MMLKMIGAVIVVGIGFISAYCCVKNDRLKLSVLDHWIALIGYIRGEVSRYLKPLGQILADADRKRIQGLGCTEKKPTLNDLLLSSSPFLTEESRQILNDFVLHAGQGYKEEQIKLCEKAEALLASEREKIAAALPEKTKLHVTLCISASLGAAILLW